MGRSRSVKCDDGTSMDTIRHDDKKKLIKFVVFFFK